MKRQNGITLVALVITIIILLILAGISIGALTNEGLFENAKKAGDKSNQAAQNEANILNEYETVLNEYLTNIDE